MQADKHPLTAVVVAKNAASLLPRCLSSLQFCNEIIVVNDRSTDETAKVAESYGAKVLLAPIKADFAQMRNYGLKAALYPWVLMIDADEEVSVELKAEILENIFSVINEAAAYRIPRQTIFLKHTFNRKFTKSDAPIRLAKVEAGYFQRLVHETWKIEAKVARLKSPLLHHTADNLTKFMAKNISFAHLHAQANIAEGKHATLLKVIFYPWGKFIDLYLIKALWRDKSYGLVFSLLGAFFSFLSWGDIWISQRRKPVPLY